MPDPYIIFILGLGVSILMVAWLPLALRKLPFSLSIMCVIFGVAVFSVGGIRFDPDPDTYLPIVEKLTEVVVIISLMGAGLKLDRQLGVRSWSTTWRLLAIAMPLTILAVTAIGLGLGLSLSVALLFGAAIAPTDPVLATDVQAGKPGTGEEGEVRFALSSEAGLNDGLAFPFVYLAIAISLLPQAPDNGIEPGIVVQWLLFDVLWRVGAALVIGWAVGRLLGWLTFGASRVKLSGTGDGLVAIGATLIAYAVAEVFHCYGFLAVFISALTLRDTERHHEYHEALHDFSDQIERVLMMLVLVLFGGAIAMGLFSGLTWIDGLAALAIVLLVRPIAGLMSLVATPHAFADRAMISFFGIRGIGSIYYIAFGLGHGDFVSNEKLWAMTGLVILISITLHGIAATPLMQWHGRQAARNESAGSTNDASDKPHEQA